MKTRILSIVLGLVFTFAINAQVTDNGFYQLRMGQFKGAREAFSKKIAQNPLDSRSIYGMGELYLAENNIDSAAANFQRGILVNKNDAYNYLGLAKIAFIKNNKEDAIAKLDLARKYGKKDAVVFTEIARIYMAQKERNTIEIDKAIAKAKEINSKTSEIYLVLAQLSAEKGQASDAANQYESAIYFDSTKFEAFIGYARIMVSAQNSKSAINYLNALIKKTPDCVVAYRELGEILFNQGKFEESASNYEKYVAKAEYTPEEKERYAYALFFSQKYDKAREIISQLSDGNPNNYIMLRLLAYTHYAQTFANTKATPDDYAKGAELFKNFFSQIPENKVLIIDYEYYAKTLISAKLDSLAVYQYQNAYNKDTSRIEYIDEMAKAYSRYKSYVKAADMYQKSFQRKQNPSIMDYYQLGVANYNAANYISSTNGDTAVKRAYFLKADTLFGTVISRNSKSYSALLMKARTKAILNPEGSTGVAKAYYDKALEILIATPEKFKRELIEIYRYNGYYFSQKEDNNNKALDIARDYFKKILDIDPNDADALKAIQTINDIKNKSADNKQ